MRDIHVDKMHRKHTLANTFGWTFGVWEYGASIVAPLALTLGIIVFEPSYWPLIVVLLVIPATLAAWTMMRTTPEGELTGAIVGFTTKLHMRYGLLVTLGLLIKGVIDL